MHSKHTQLNKAQALWCFAAAALVITLCSKSSPLYGLNDWMDANIFYTMGKGMLNGQVLYRDIFDHKGPLLYFLYGLGYLADRDGFIGVWLLEILAFSLFLYVSTQTAALLRGEGAPLPPPFCLLPAVAVASSRTFSHGGSAEELLLPFLAFALYDAVRILNLRQNLPLRRVLAHGFLAGCALWLKYTILGFYLAWVILLAAIYLFRKQFYPLGTSIIAYLGGIMLATLPWVLYFGVNGALSDWYIAYFYDNLFLYTGSTASLANLLQHIWWAMRDAWYAAVCAFLFAIWAVHRRQLRTLAAIGTLAGGLCFTTLMGGYLVYYGLVLTVFAPLCLAAVSDFSFDLPLKKYYAALSAALTVLAAGWCLLAGPNHTLLGRTRNNLPQYQFAETIGNGTLLNYGTLDGGFYTAAGALAPCKYFCVTNMPLPAQWEQQQQVLSESAVEYVVALTDALQNDYPQYLCIDAATYNGGEGNITWYLYQLQMQ